MLISVRFLFGSGKRLSPYQVKIQRGVVGWLVMERSNYGLYEDALQARLVDAAGADLLATLDRAVVTASGSRGMQVVGVNYVARGVKHSRALRQAWWCQAPPVEAPLIDHDARVRDMEAAYLAPTEWERS